MTQSRKERRRAGRQPEGMRINMFRYLTVFTMIVLIVIWLLQAVFLEGIYQQTKKHEIKNATGKIEAAAGKDIFEKTVYEIASRYNACVSVYQITGSTGELLIQAHTQTYCMIHSSLMTDMTLNTIYAGALDGNLYTSISETDTGKEFKSMVCAKLVSGADKAENLLIILNAEIQPVRATISTLRYQLIMITVILLAVSAVMAYIISNKVTKPVSAMNKEAKKLARGNYDVNFQGGEFRETVELGRTLNYAAQELAKLDDLQKELIANISHDLRTPLTMISGYSEMMRDIPGEITPENMQIIIDETQHLSALVNDMLDLSRVTSGSRQPNKTLFSLTQCVRDTLERFSHLREGDGYHFVFDAAEEIYVEADQVLILQVLYNLICNAVNYTGADKQVLVRQTREGEICRISVTDTGDGIDAEKLPMIWDRYYRASDFHKRGIAGTGLGLSIVKNALVLHDAPFGVSSKKGEGSTFWFELQIAQTVEDFEK
ncbi:MAG: HAMP domain-containing histidine kinase [Clostridiales bacterium]|nr:HAMP domain-containing histidine kinase [Clostridiales bacterium]